MSRGEPSASDAARLQPPREDLLDTTAERQQAADSDERLARLAGDRDLVQELRRHHFAGPTWQRAAEELARYGVAVLTAWMLNGKIYGKCARAGRAIERAPAGVLDHDEAESVAGEVVTVALRHFRDDVLVPGMWDPTRGASLTTFFTGQCLLRLPNIWRAWLPQHVERTCEEVVLNQMISPDSVEDDVLRSLTASTALQDVRSDQARRAFVLGAAGYSVPEIAERLGTTEDAIEGAIAYARKKARRPRETA